MSRPRLLVVASTYPAQTGDGVPAFVRDLAEREAQAFETLVVVPRIPGAPRVSLDGPLRVRRFAYFPSRWEDLADGAILENLRARPWRWLQVPGFFLAEVVAVRRAVRRFRPDVVHAHWIVPQGLVMLAVPRRIPVLLTTLGGDLYALGSGPAKMLKARAVARAAHVTVMNADMRRRVVDLGADPDAVSLLPMGADLQSVRRREPGARSRRLLFVGRLVEKKGLGVLLDALRRLPDDERWPLLVVGDGPERGALEAAAAGLDVTFAGQLGRPDLMSAYAESDIAVFPSVVAPSGDQDGLPVALLEAMAAGCAVVVSDLPGLDEAVRDGVSGVVVPSGDAGALAEALRALGGAEDRRDALGRAAEQSAEGYSADAVGGLYRQVLLGILDQPADGSGRAAGLRATST
ncbi:glycosyltransferase family 4 protein [Cellulomonas sp. URHD0024]|uniref:glycosyltransferase family 4 protein n=1 Tax=Cellulomonas sp. URHD0024 TaxID=1302620 RepID=UPI0006888A3B|nr:glycosyltransferase family 4 protein [Cellulomonas sp. URHD0024]